MMKRILNDENGMTLIEILIASSILLVVALGFSQLMANQAKQQKRMADHGQQQEWQVLFQYQVNPGNSLDAYRKTAGIE